MAPKSKQEVPAKPLATKSVLVLRHSAGSKTSQVKCPHAAFHVNNRGWVLHVKIRRGCSD